jgi:hypothetical protein
MMTSRTDLILLSSKYRGGCIALTQAKGLRDRNAQAPPAKGATVRDYDLVSLSWRESSACWESQCVTVAAHAGRVLVRDTSDASKTTISINRRDWAVFVTRIRDSMKGHVSPPTGLGKQFVRPRGNAR